MAEFATPDLRLSPFSGFFDTDAGKFVEPFSLVNERRPEASIANKTPNILESLLNTGAALAGTFLSLEQQKQIAKEQERQRAAIEKTRIATQAQRANVWFVIGGIVLVVLLFALIVRR